MSKDSKKLYREFNASGHPIFGLHGFDKNMRCKCENKDCKVAGKHPLRSGWQHTPIWDEEQLETMELLDQMTTGYGVLCKNLLVIDVDARNGGVASFERLRNDVPEIDKVGLIVNTGSGGGSKHLYFSIIPGTELQAHHEDYPGIDFRSGKAFVVGPGSIHASGNHYEVAYGSVDDIESAPEDLINFLRKPERHRDEVQGSFFDVSHADLADLVNVIDPDTDHETWIRCGMALHHASGGTAFDVWDAWSNHGTKYPGRDTLAKRWHSFGKSANPVRLGTLIYFAEQAGWVQPVTFEAEEDFGEF